MTITTDSFEPIVGAFGLRTFSVDRRHRLHPITTHWLRALRSRMPDIPGAWSPEGTCQATCRKGRVHTVPDTDCTCGIYACYCLDDLRDIHPELASQLIAVIEPQGRGEAGDWGFRCQSASIVALWSDDAEHAAAVGAASAPQAAIYSDLDQMITDHGLRFTRHHPWQRTANPMLRLWGAVQSRMFTIRNVVRYPPLWSLYWALIGALAISQLAALPLGVSDAVTAAGEIGRGLGWLLYRCDQDHAVTGLACITVAALMINALAALLGEMLSLRGLLSRILGTYGGLALLAVLTMALMNGPVTIETLAAGICALLAQVVIIEAPAWRPRRQLIARWRRNA